MVFENDMAWKGGLQKCGATILPSDDYQVVTYGEHIPSRRYKVWKPKAKKGYLYKESKHDIVMPSDLPGLVDMDPTSDAPTMLPRILPQRC